MLSKLIINKYQNGRETQTTEILFKEKYINGKVEKETIYGTWRIGEVLRPIKDQRLVVNMINHEHANDIDFETITCHIDKGNLEILNSGIPNYRDDGFITFDTQTLDANVELNDVKNKRKIDQISEFLIKKANGEVQNNNEQLCTDMLDKNLGKISKNNEIILKNIYILNEKLQYLKKKEVEETTVARLANVSHVCEKCGSIFSKYATFQYHMKTHKLRGDAASKVREYRSITRPVNSKFNPVWVCPFCYQAWPSQTTFQEHLFKSECNSHLETENKIPLEMILNQAIKRHISQLMHCEFCEKLFTNITKVLKHQKEHRTDKNYQCVPCNYIFDCYNNATQHWRDGCHWKKHIYIFTQPKYLICNICYEKFESWDNLYLHRYEYEHFVSKCKEKETDDEGDDGTGYRKGKRKKEVMKYDSVLQCEGCGKVYLDVEELSHHREEIHLQMLCQICGHIADCKDNFLEHMKDHNQSDNA